MGRARDRLVEAITGRAVEQASRAVQPAGRTGAHPAGGEVRDPRAATQNFPGTAYNGFSKPMLPEWDADTAFRFAYYANIFVYRCVQITAQAIASMPFRAGADPSKPGDYDVKARLAQLLGPPPLGPAPKLSARKLWQWSVAQYLVTGRLAWELELAGQGFGNLDIVNLWPLASSRFAAIPSTSGVEWFRAFTYNYGSQTPVNLRPENVFYAWRGSARDFRQPESVLQAARLEISVAVMQERYDYAFLRNDARPASVVVHERFAKTTERDAFREQFLGSYGGPDNAGKVAFVEAGDSDEETPMDVRGSLHIEALGLSQRDAQFIQRYDQKLRAICVAFGTPVSKLGDASDRCLRASEYVRLANGERHQAKDLVGTHFTLLTSTPAGQVEVGASASWQAIVPVYAVTTDSGRRLEVNGRHPLYCAAYTLARDTGRRTGLGPRIDVAGWTPVDEIEPGVLVAVPSRFDQHQDSLGLTADEAAVLGYLVGDGSISGGRSGDRRHVALTTPDGEMVKDFQRCVEAMGDEVSRYQTGTRVATWGVRARSRVGAHGGYDTNRTRALLRRTGLLGTTSHTKFIPSEVFASSPPARAAFLGALIATDGCISLGKTYGTKNPAGIASVTVSTVSHRLALDTQELLMRMGVSSTIRQVHGRGGIPAMGDRIFHSYQVTVVRAQDVQTLLTEVSVPGKQEKCDAALERVAGKLADKAHGGNVHTWRTKGLDPGLHWEKVKSIEPVGVDQTVGITVPGHNTYLSTFYEHNTFSNAKDENRNWWRDTVYPLAVELQDEVNLQLAPRLDPGKVGWFDTSGVPELQPEPFWQPEPLSNLVGVIISRGEARVEVGFPEEVPDDFEKKAPPAVLGFAAQPAAPPAAAEGAAEGEPAAPSVPAPPKPRLAEVVEIRDAIRDGRDLIPPDAKDAERQAAHMERRGVEARQAADHFDTLEVTWEAEFKRLFAQQRTSTLAKLHSRRGRPVTRGLSESADGIFNVGHWNGVVTDAAQTLYRQTAQLAAHRLNGHAVRAVATAPTLEMDQPAVVRFIQQRSNQLAGQVNDTTYQAIKDQLSEGVAAGENVDDLADRIGTVFDAAPVRAKTIARTESISGYNGATATIFDTYGPDVAAGQEWLATNDDRTRADHSDADGQQVAAGEQFQVGGESLAYPGDPDGSPENTVNCRCTTLILTPEDMGVQPDITRSTHLRSIPLEQAERAAIRLALTQEAV